MTDSSKRKERPAGNGDNRGNKRSKGGSGGKWQTPHYLAKVAASRGSGKIEPGDVGIWATCARRQEGRATEELKAMFEECAERFYGLVSDPQEVEDEEAFVDDIEASIQKEVASMSNKQGPTKLFSPVHLDLDCVLFFKTRSDIDPVDFVHRICVEVISKPDIRRMRYANRLTPVSIIGKATEKGLEEVANAVLGAHFQLSGEDGKVERREGDGKEGDAPQKRTPFSYAIRPTIRNHTTLKRDAVIKQVASMVGDMHKVDLTAPDKVIIVEIYQTVCGMSIVGSDWESLKRFNLAELYQPTKPPLASKAEASLQSVTTDEARPGDIAPLSTATESPVTVHE